MAAFSYTHSSLLLDSSPVLFHQPEFSQQPTSISSFTTCTAQFLHHDHDEIQSLTEKKQSPDSSTSSVVLDQNPPIGKQFTKKMSSVDKKRKDRDGFPSTTSAQSMRITKKKSPKGDNLKEKKVQEADKKVQKKKVPEEVEITGYVHVRARRGEATDSHSLAERARREKISERMKLLQSLVPGCDKISGKAFVLDEIISYVQTLQTQVEFLSMKLASVDPLCNDVGRDLYAPEPKPEVLDTNILPPQPTFQECFQECNTLEAMAYGDEQTKTSFNMASSYPLLDSPQSIQFGNHLLMEMPNNLHQDDFEQFLWDMEGQRQKQPNHDQYGFTTNLCS